MTNKKPDIIKPVEIGRVNEYDLKIVWKDGLEIVYPARELRLACPCALCIEEMTGKPLIEEDKIPADVHPQKIRLVGNYAISIDWSDGHNTGIYTFERLRTIAEKK